MGGITAIVPSWPWSSLWESYGPFGPADLLACEKGHCGVVEVRRRQMVCRTRLFIGLLRCPAAWKGAQPPLDVPRVPPLKTLALNRPSSTSSTIMDSRHHKSFEAAAVPRLNHLCDSCRSIFPPLEPWPWLEEYSRRPNPHPNIPGLNEVLLTRSSVSKLEASSETGCHLCMLILEALLPERQVMRIKMDQRFQTGPILDRWTEAATFHIQMIRSMDSPAWILRITYDSSHHGTTAELLLMPVKPVYPCDEHHSIRQVWTLPIHCFPPSPDKEAFQTLSSTNVNALAMEQVKKLASRLH